MTALVLKVVVRTATLANLFGEALSKVATRLTLVIPRRTQFVTILIANKTSMEAMVGKNIRPTLVKSSPAKPTLTALLTTTRLTTPRPVGTQFTREKQPQTVIVTSELTTFLVGMWKWTLV